jgi:hypothetical protein
VDIRGKVEAIVEFSTDPVKTSTDLYDEFFHYNDLGIPLAIAINADLCEINDEGVKIIEDTFRELCDAMNIDFTKEYENYDEMLEESINNNKDQDS